MHLRTRDPGRRCVSTVVAWAVFVAAGLVVAAPSPAEATVAPTVSVSDIAGPIGSVVTVTFSSPAGNRCGEVEFGPESGLGAGYVFLPFSGDSGSDRFVIPSVLYSGPSTPPDVPVSPGHYAFSLTCDTSNLQATAISVSLPFTVTTVRPSRFVGLAPTRDGGGYWLA